MKDKMKNIFKMCVTVLHSNHDGVQLYSVAQITEMDPTNCVYKAVREYIRPHVFSGVISIPSGVIWQMSDGVLHTPIMCGLSRDMDGLINCSGTASPLPALKNNSPATYLRDGGNTLTLVSESINAMNVVKDNYF